MTNKAKLKRIFTSNALVYVIGYFLKRDFGHVRLIERETGLEINSVRREIKKLSDIGLVFILKEEKQKRIWMWNENHEWAKPIRKIFSSK